MPSTSVRGTQRRSAAADDANDGTTNNTQPAWSPDGRRIVFRTNRSDPSRNVADIWVMDSPFGPVPGQPSAQPLVVRPGDERYPTFSPDGTRLLFRGDDDGIAPSGDEEIYVARAYARTWWP